MQHRILFKTLSIIAGSITAVIGILVLSGWQFDITILKTFGFGAVTMKPNASALFLLAGLTLLFLQLSHPIAKWLSKFLSSLIFLVGILSLTEFIFTVDLGIDELLFSVSDVTGFVPHPSRIAANAALNFLLLGTVLFYLSLQRPRLNFFIEFCLVSAFSISVVGFLSFTFGFNDSAGAAGYARMPVNAAAAFIVLCIGIYFTIRLRIAEEITIEAKLFAALTTTATIIVFISLLSVSNIRSMHDATDLIKHTNVVKIQLEDLFTSVIDIETGSRGFVISGNEVFLEPMIKANQKIENQISTFRNLTTDNPLQQNAINNMERLIIGRIRFSELQINTRKLKGLVAAAALTETGKGKQLTDSIRILKDQMIAEENLLLSKRENAEVDRFAQTRKVTFGGFLFQIILLSLMFLFVKKDVSGKRKAEQELKKLNVELEDRVKERTASLAKSEERYRNTLDNLLEGGQIIDFDYRYLYLNDVAAKQGRCTKEELFGHTMMEMYPGIEKSQMFDKLRSCMVERIHQEMENEFVYPDGTKAWFDLHMEPVPEGVFILSIDITERKHAEEKILKANRVYSVISQINQMIVRTRNKDELFREACRIAIDFGKFQMAWIGLVDERTQIVNPVVHSGIEDGYLSTIKNICISDVPEGRGPTGTAIREGRHFICNDIASDEALCLWWDEALKRGYRSSIAVPIKLFGKVIGAFSLYARVPHFFDQEEIVLLDEVTNDISFALEIIETENKRIEGEKALQESEKRFHTTLDNMMESCQIIGNDWKYIFLNKEAEKQNRRPNVELIGNKVMDMWPGIESTEVFQMMKQCMESRLAQEKEIEFTFPNLSKEWFNVSIEPGSDGIFIRSSKITDRKLAEEKIKKSEENYRSIFESFQDVYYRTDLEGKITTISPSIKARAGYEPSELIGRNVSEVYADPANRNAFMTQLMKQGSVLNYELNLLCKDGSIINVTAASRIIFGDGGKPIAIEGTLHDISELKHSAENLRKSEEQFRLISENVADMITVIDLNGKRIYNSPSYKPILGDPQSLRGTDSFKEIHPEDQERIKSIFQETVKTGIGQRAEYRFLLKDGSIRSIESQGSVIRDKDGIITNVVVVSRDVTEKKQLEQQFMRMQRMESIGTLAGGVAHDLNNVLAPILLAIEILKKSILDERSQKMFDTLEVSARRGSDIVKQILGFARGVEGERTLLQLRHIIEDTITIIKQTFPKSISIRQEIPKNIWTILGDSTQLHQVIMNLCINASDAMPNGGTVKIFAENKIIDEQYARTHIEAKPGNYLMISVEDTGTGMPPDVVNRIFEPFFTTKERGKGTGLGLSTVHTIVKSHNGFINVHSEVGKGTNFKIYLPAAEAEQVKPSGFEIKELLTGNGELILVVDDEASICEITKQTLETFGYRAITACDGTEALAIYASQGKDIDLVITDMLMPYMDGARTILALRNMNPSVKIIASSGLNANGQTKGDDRIVADIFLAKPYNAEKLLEMVHSVLHKKS